MAPQKYFDTVTETLNYLIDKGYTIDFSLISDKECLMCNATKRELSAKEFEIDEVHRFEGNSDPSDEMIIFAISSSVHNIKGYLVNAFGMYANTKNSILIKKLRRTLK
jgi:hypothetical protein